MEQPQRTKYGPWIADGGMLRLSPMQEVIAQRNSASKGGDPSSTGGSSGANLSIDPKAAQDPRVPAGTIEAAQQGDPNAIDFLKGIGLIGGPALMAAMYKRKTQGKGPGTEAPKGSGPKPTPKTGLPANQEIPVHHLDWEVVPPDPEMIQQPKVPLLEHKAPTIQGETAKRLENAGKALRRVIP